MFMQMRCANVDVSLRKLIGLKNRQKKREKTENINRVGGTLLTVVLCPIEQGRPSRFSILDTLLDTGY